jgi:type II secretory pathway pseudopilin PulG
VVDKIMKRKIIGFTLLEVLLVLVIGTTILGLVLNYTTLTTDQFRRNKEAVQIQQILNAALAYYVQYGRWPGNTNGQWTCLDSNHNLMSSNYVPAGKGASGIPGCSGSTIWLSAYSTPFSTGWDTTTNNFYVITQIPTAKSAPTNSLVISGMLPLGVTATANGSAPPVTAASCLATGSCYVSSGVSPPGQSLNNARSINFAGIYHHGACVPAPTCPTNTSPTVFVVPISVSGVSYKGSTDTYPISSFTAYAYGAAGTPPGTAPVLGGGSTVASCATPSSGLACSASGPGSAVTPAGAISTSISYWRVCMQVQTSQGLVSTTNTGAGAESWGQYATVAAFTRCVPNNEPFGSDISVFTQ